MHTGKVVQQNSHGVQVAMENVATSHHSASVPEGVSRCRNALINGDTTHYDWDSGYTCHQLGDGFIIVQLAQPYIVGSVRLLLWDCDDRKYGYYIEVSTDQRRWNKVVDKSDEACSSWQTLSFEPRPVAFIKITGTKNTANEVFHCVHFECPSSVPVGATAATSIVSDLSSIATTASSSSYTVKAYRSDSTSSSSSSGSGDSTEGESSGLHARRCEVPGTSSNVAAIPQCIQAAQILPPPPPVSGSNNEGGGHTGHPQRANLGGDMLDDQGNAMEDDDT